MNKKEYTEAYYKHLFEKLNERAYLLEKMLKKKKEEAEKKKASKLDPVGKEDDDIDNDGKPNTETDQYLKNRRAKIRQELSKKKGVVKEGTVITDGNIFYGGFPKLNESWDEYMGHINVMHRQWQKMPRGEASDTFDRTLDRFKMGEHHLADELLDMGADKGAVEGALRVGPAAIKKYREGQAKLNPRDLGYDRPSPNNWTGD
jgi:hypothetical protein